MTERRVWIAQCLCPQRHAILATAGEADDEANAEVAIRAPLRATIGDLIELGQLNPWCGLCNAKADTWKYELTRSRFRTMEEGEPELRKAEAEQMVMAAVFGDMKRSD